jgi:hypothetical protein
VKSHPLKVVMIAGCIAAALLCVLIVCKSSAPVQPEQPADIVGHWKSSYGWPPDPQSGQSAPDTSRVVLDIKADSTFFMVRSRLAHGSAGDEITDTATEDGTVSVQGTAAILNAIHCARYSWDSMRVISVPCSDPMRLPIHMQNGVWPIKVKDSKTSDTLPYDLRKY